MALDTPRALEHLFTPRVRTLALPDSWPGSDLDLISLAYGFADPALFPREELAEATAAVLADDAARALNYGPTFPGLVEFVADRLRQRGIPAAPERVLIGYGSSQILGLLPHVLIEPGDTVIVEGPTFLGAVRDFADGGARIVGVPVDGDGMDVAALEATLRDLARRGERVKFIYTIPTFQNPTGTTLTLPRRQRLIDLACAHGVLIVEDDAYADLRFEGALPPPLAALDPEGVLHVGTFSKILAPGVRMGWACGPQAVIDRLRMVKVEGSSGPFLTRVIHRFCQDGRLDRHIAALNAHYRAKRDVMLAALAHEFPTEARWTRPQGGFFVWCELPEGISAAALQAASEARGATFLAGGHCFADGQGDNAIRLAFSFQSAEQIRAAVAIIGTALRAMAS
jgi:DNA-binding transcriptional MocR family regulator